MGSRLWEIRESYGQRQKYDDPELQEAYECGYEDAMEEASGRSSMGHRGEDRYMGERMGYRRMRDSRGRYM